MKRKLKEWHSGPLLHYCIELFANLRFLWSKVLKFQSHDVIKSLKYLELSSELLLSWTITAKSSSYCVWHLLCKVDVVDARSAFQHSRCRAEELLLDLLCIDPTQAVYVSRSPVSQLALEHGRWLVSAGHLMAKKDLGNLPCEMTVGKGCVRPRDWLSSSHLPLVFIRSFETIYLLICHHIDSLLLRTINIVRAIHSVAQLIIKDKTGTSQKSWAFGGINAEDFCRCCNLKWSSESCNSKALVWLLWAQSAKSPPKRAFKSKAKILHSQIWIWFPQNPFVPFWKYTRSWKWGLTAVLYSFFCSLRLKKDWSLLCLGEPAGHQLLHAPAG